MTDFKKLKVVELRAELAARNLPQDGKKDELIERLEEYEFHNAEPTQDEEMSDAPSVTQPTPSPVEPSVQPISSPAEPSISHHSTPSVNPEPETTLQTEESLQAIEEEKRRQRALRFGLAQDETAQVKIEVAINRLEHALPNRSHHHHRHGRRHRRNHHSHKQHRNSPVRQVFINKP